MVVGESRPETDCVGVRLRIKKVREEGFTNLWVFSLYIL